MLVWSATCSRRNHAADRLCSNGHPAMVTSFSSWFKSDSKSSFIEGTWGAALNTPEVPITTPELVCLPALTQEKTERPSGCYLSNFHSIMDVTESCWASCGSVCSATCYLPNPGGFRVNLCVFFSPRTAEYPFWTCSLKLWFLMRFSERCQYLGELSPLIPTPPSQFLYHCLSFVAGKPLLHSGYSAAPVHFYSGTAEVRELEGGGRNDRHGKNANTF